MRRSQVSALLLLASLTAAALVAVLVVGDLASSISSQRVTAVQPPARTTNGVRPTPARTSGRR